MSGATAAPSWVLLDSEGTQVKVEPSWTKLLADSDKLNKTFWLKSKIGLSLDALHETLPKYTTADLVIVHRQSKKGVWKDELWTKRAFGPQELQFAPMSSQLNGVLFFLVGRTSEATAGNMSLETVSFHHTVDLTLPLKKMKKAKVQWESKDSPTIPILVNLKSIKEHTRLTLFQEVAKKDKE